MKRKIIWGVVAFFLLALLGAALNSWHSDRLDAFVRLKIEEYSKSQLPVDILPGKTEIQLLPFNVKISDIKIVPKKSLAAKIKPIEISHIQLSPSFLHLFLGKLQLSYLHADTVTVDLSLTMGGSGPAPETDLDGLLRLVPISQLQIEHLDLNLLLREQEKTFSIHARDIFLLATNDVSSLALQVKVAALDASRGKDQLVRDAQVGTHMFLTNKNLILSELKFKEGGAFILASGSTQHNLVKKVLTSANINVRTQFDAERIKIAYDLFKANGEKNPLDDLHGQVRGDLQIKSTGLEKMEVSALAEVHDLAFQKFRIGNLAVSGELFSASENFHLKKARLETPGVLAEAQGFNLNLKTLSFSDAKVELKKFELSKFLDYAINQKVPAHGEAVAALTCSGNLKNFLITCPGEFTATNMRVDTGADKKQLVALEKIQAEGQVSVNLNEVTYSAQLHTERSKGSSQGVVNFKTGFDVKYDSPLLDLDEIKKVSVVGLGGSGTASGSAQGDSRAAVFDIAFDGKSVELEKYKLGDVSAHINYKAGHLYVNKIQGTLVSSRYLGQVAIDFERNWLLGKLQMPFLDLAVIKESIKAHLPIPVALAGSGSAIVDLDGPLNPDKLSFKAKARLYNCRLGDQHFDTADVDVSSDMGHVVFNSLSLDEKNSNLVFTGGLDLDQKNYDMHFKSQKYFLDDFEYVKVVNAPAKGLFDLSGAISGKFDSPGVDAKFSSNNFSLSGESMSPIHGEMHINHSKKIVTVAGPNELKFTYKDFESAPDVQIEANSKNLNLAPLITSVMGIKQVEDYHITTSAAVNLRLNKKDFTKINGYVFVPDISLRFQKNELKNEKEISFFFTNGKLNFAAFLLAGKNGKLEFKSSSASVLPIDMQISGLFNLSFAQIFAPFLETLEGLASVNLRMRGDYSQVHFIGSSFIDDGFVKLAEIPHAIEDLQVDILFNQEQVIVNSLKGRFASGQLLGDGKILLKGKKNLPMTLNLHLDNIDLNIPAQVNTKGNADFKLTGNWMPFTLSGTYQVQDGLVSKELGGGEASSVSPHQVFLPQVLRDETAAPILLDLAIILNAPLKVKNQYIDGSVEGRLKVAGNPQTPILGGNVALVKNSLIKFMDVPFKVRDSNFTMNNSVPPNPGLYLVADAYYRGYDIEMLVQGTADKPRFKWSSSPSLTEPDIISLLTLGQVASQQVATTTSTNTSTTTPVSGSGNLNPQQSGTALFAQNPLSRELKSRFGFDIQFASKFDTANSVAVPQISAAKQINAKTSLVGSYQTGRDARSDLNLRYQLSKMFSARAGVQSQRQEEANQQKGNTLLRSDILGLDLEFRKEFK